ncbi:MAG: hypothetical protein ABII74_08600 [Elusimicrobiota bacterium]
MDTKEGLDQRFYQLYSKEALQSLLERHDFQLIGDIKEYIDERGEINYYVIGQKKQESTSKRLRLIEKIKSFKKPAFLYSL